MLEYNIIATVQKGGQAKAMVNHSEISFDATSGRHEMLPNPAELLLTSFAACILKNVERYSEILKISYRSAKISIKGTRSDNPPMIQEINYLLEIDTDADDKKLQNWHKNILKFGTITNTLAKACTLNGKVIKRALNNE